MDGLPESRAQLGATPVFESPSKAKLITVARRVTFVTFRLPGQNSF
jgi:hypothetical protein